MQQTIRRVKLAKRQGISQTEMNTFMRTEKHLMRYCAAALTLMITAVAVSADTTTPNEWLDRMSMAVKTMNFEGTVIRRRDGLSEAVKVLHKIVDGVVHEKVVTQEGNGLEIIRIGNEVRYILPDKKSVLVDHWNDDSALFSTLPARDLRFGNEYDLSIVREERVAGRQALVLAIRPHDSYRYGHRIWLDSETSFPLRTELVAGDGALIEQLKFVEIKLDSDISRTALKSSFSLAGYTWYSEPARSEVVDVESQWISDELPAGFRLLSTTNEMMANSDVPVVHIVFSDGLATVSVFIATNQDGAVPENSAVGASSSYSVERNDCIITVIGKVPLATVRRIAVSMRQQ